MELETIDAPGREIYRAVPSMPSYVATHLVGGAIVRGTCLTCGDSVNVGVDMDGVSGIGGAEDDAGEYFGEGSERPTAAIRGERRGGVGGGH